MHSTAKLLPSVISKWIHIFWRIQYFFITAKNLNVLRNVSVSVEFYCKVATFSHFKVNSFFSENPCTFLKQPKVWSFREMLVFQLDSTANLLPPANFYTFKIFVRKTHFFILKKPEVWRFWGLLQFQSILRKLCCLCHFERIQFFSKNRSILHYFQNPKVECFGKPY